MDPILVDTDVFSFFFKGDSRRVAYEPELFNKQMSLAFMSVAELLRWANTRNWGAAKRRALLESFSRCVVLPYDFEMAQAWASIFTARARAGRPIECGDCWIAATAVRHGLPLVTHNASDFADIDGLRVISHA